MSAAASVAAVATGLLLFAPPALAAKKHFLTSSFATSTGSSTNAYLPALNQSTGHLYVPTQGEAHKVYNFNAGGTLDPTTPELTGTAINGPWGVAVDNSSEPTAGDIYVADGPVKQFSPSGAFTGQTISEADIPGGELRAGFSPLSTAVDSHGNVYVSDLQNGVIDEFTSAAIFIRQFGAGQLSVPWQLAVDSAGDVYVANEGSGTVEFDSAGNCVNSCAPIDSAGQFGVAVDSAGDVYVQHGRGSATIVEYPPGGGAPLEEFGAGEITGAFGIAVNSSGAGGVPVGTVYVNDQDARQMRIFSYLEAEAFKLKKTGSGAGTVISSLPGIQCGSTCETEFGKTSTLTLTATRATHSKFTGWSGCPHVLSSGEFTASKCEVEISGPTEIEAQFTAIPQANLEVEVEGAGKVTSSLAGISCTSGTCTEHFDTEGPEATVTLTAHPVPGNRLVAWTGCKAEPSPAECEVEMTVAHKVKAQFTPSASHALTKTFGDGEPTSATNVEDPYPLAGPSDVVLDESGGTSNGDIYVTDPGHHRVEKFDSSGHFLSMFGKEVNRTEVEAHATEAQQNVCTQASGNTCQEGTSGSVPGELEAPSFLAVDDSPGGNGAVYVADTGDDLVSKFDSSGRILSGWGLAGQKDGSDAKFGFGGLGGLAVDGAGNLYVLGEFGAGEKYTQAGTWIEWVATASGNAVGIKFDSGSLYTSHTYGFENYYGVIFSSASSQAKEEQGQRGLRVTTDGNTTGLAFDPLTHELFQDVGGELIDRYSECAPTEGHPCAPTDSFGVGDLSGARGLAVDALSNVYVANTESNDVAVLADIQPQATTGPSTAATETTLTLSGQVQRAGHSEIKKCEFEYGLTKAYGHTIACEPSTPYSASPEAVEATITGLAPLEQLPPGAEYHYRLRAENAAGASTVGADRTAITAAPPLIEGVSSSHLGAASAELDATIKPNRAATTYRFQYGTTTAYGETTATAEIAGDVEELSQPHKVAITVEGLQPGATYHYRLLAENSLDPGHPATSADHSFEFFPPACPNAAVRQQTGSAYLPDCRAYELVSPSNANGTLLFTGAPTSPYATSPSRFAFTGAFGAPPETTENIGADGDLYVATRTDTGWQSHYVGLPGNQTGCMGGPPNYPESHSTGPDKIQKSVLADPSLGRILSFDLGSAATCFFSGNGTSDASQDLEPASNAPYLWNAEGALLAHLPTDLSSTPGAGAALSCPAETINTGNEELCSGDVAASGDLSHLVFSSNTLSFSGAGEPAGLTVAPGSAYDDDLATGKLTLISTLKGGGEIHQDPAYAVSHPACNHPGEHNGGFPPCPDGEFIRFPAVSADGSHVLMSTATAVTPWCRRTNSVTVCSRFTDTPVHLYMSIGDRPAVEVSYDELTHEDVAVSYVGMTEDGSKVFFTSEAHLTSEDPEHGGASLYMWSQAGEEEIPPHPITLISKGETEEAGEPGDTAECHPALIEEREFSSSRPTGKEIPWTKQCGVLPYSGWSYAHANGSPGGNGHSDTAIAQNGDVYFFSPEQLDGSRGVPGQQNLYDYRQGRAQYVTTLSPAPFCEPTGFEEQNCTEDGIARFQVTPQDSHAAFVTADRVTNYDNAGHLEMYSYTPATGNLVCDSCNPDGKPPTADVYASQNGLFLTEDGRTFFSTTESLAPQDTNRGVDVYEYVDGRPQLITPGTGTATRTGNNFTIQRERPGLIGVSANGTDVYFSTFDSLISEDHNGEFFKFYDARTNGGFPQPPPVQPCAAAEECHGPGTEAPALPQITSNGAPSTGGNANPNNHHKKKHHKHHHRRANTKRGGSK